MKKLILLATFGVAGLVSARDYSSSLDSNSEKSKFEIIKGDSAPVLKKGKKSKKNNPEEQFGCLTFRTSCGWTTVACGYGFIDIALNRGLPIA